MTRTSLVRHARTVVGVLASAAVTSVLTVGASAAPANADTIPYVPWSSYLAGWTDEFIPSSDNDCVAGRANCLHQTLKELSRIADDTAASCSHNAIFPRAYLRMTQLYGHTREIPNYYEHLAYFNHVDAVFARYYTDAYYNWESGNRGAVPQSWLIALDAAQSKQVSGSGDLLLGMNAHINRDLPFVMAAVGLVTPEGASGKGDYDAAEEWLYDATAPLLAEFAARFDPKIDDSSDPLGLSNAALFQMVSGWREAAWRNAEALISAPTPEARALVAANIEADANAAAQLILAAQSYVPLVSSTVPRDTFCAANNGASGPMPYDFGYADPWGYAY